MVSTGRGSWRIEIAGVVQGVGFRPFVHRIANELGIDGVVGNDAARVFVEILATEDQCKVLRDRLAADAPPLAVIDSIALVPSSRTIEPGTGFAIVASEVGSGGRRTFVSPDTAVCDDCLAEFFDPANRRFAHPFITCTNCGPRFTITRSLPYDRASTTMADFEMCAQCREEYEDPNDRRFHAQPIGCHDCGPVLRWQVLGDTSGTDPIEQARAVIAADGTVAVKGLGGFHLACSARSDTAIEVLRSRKHRPDKPFAVMVANLAEARSIAEVTDAEVELLTSPARPIVLCRVRPDSGLSPLVAPANPLIGIMLPYTPIHHLLFTGSNAIGPLVMTSGNYGGEPICYLDDDVPERLGPLIDGILTHDRAIHVPCDDSVMRVTGAGLLPIRRARGYAPMPLSLGAVDPATGERADVAAPAILAVGGELKNAFCITNGRHAWMSQHIGDMENLETLHAFQRSVGQFQDLYDIEPEIVVADTHPGYRSSGWARTNHGDRVVEVQHHHAHVAAVMAEHGLIPSESVLGVAFDGTGDGTDGTIWGGELLIASALDATRVGHLRPIALPGGDAAIRHPWRVALSHLSRAGITWNDALPPVRHGGEIETRLLERQLERNIACVPTTSMGRFFDALASLVGLRHEASYEAQAAIEFEIAAAAWTGATPDMVFSLADPTPMLETVCREVLRSTPTGSIARACHLAIADGVGRRVIELCNEHSLATVVLSGGVFQNALLAELLIERIDAAGLRVLTHSLVPPNDGGLALGQAFIAHARATSHTSRLGSARLAADAVPIPNTYCSSPTGA